MDRNNQIKTIAGWLQSGSINLFGMPYAGKDTQGKRLAEFFNAPLLGGGYILRNSVIPPHVKKLVDAGLLAPTDEYLKIVLPFLSREEFKGRPLILSSVGRWKGEEEGVLLATRESGHPLKAVVYMSINETTLRERWHKAQHNNDRGERVDDAENILQTRIDEFEQKTLPVIEAYRNLGLLIEVDGGRPLDEVTTEILTGLVALSQKS